MMRIFLIGYMGSGKTTLGKAFARDMGLSFIDLDWYIEERYHKTVQEIFAEKGEEGFREIERQMLREVGEIENIVISAGGGTPCFFDNMEYMNSSGITVYLNTSTDILFNRLKPATQSRPILKGKKDEELREFIATALEKRLPFYGKAHLHFIADELEDRTQIDHSVQRLKELIWKR
ncbi:MAG: shikimate kinase [Bacteroides sp.]|nr:shikimate kinase [Bacteroides sp.]